MQYLHPESFEPSREAPLTLAKKVEAAPLYVLPEFTFSAY